MRIECGHCGAAYSVADEKIAGRALKLRCKKCDEPIRVDGTRLGEPEDESKRELSFGVDPFSESSDEAAGSSEDDAVWHIAVGDTTQGPYTLDELASYYAQGSVVLDTLVFRDGWQDWRPAGEIEELREAADGAKAAAEAGDGEAPAAGPASLMRGQISMGEDPFAEHTPGPRVSAQDIVKKGPGHEGTVQFSLDEIRAISAVTVPSTMPGVAPAPSMSSAPAARAGYASGEGSGLIDMRALAQLAREPEEQAQQAVPPLDSLAPLALPTFAQPAPDQSSFHLKLALGVAAFALVLAAGVVTLALVYRPAPPQQLPAVAAALPMPAAAEAAPEPAQQTRQQSDEAEPADEAEANAEQPEPEADDEAEAEPAHKPAPAKIKAKVAAAKSGSDNRSAKAQAQAPKRVEPRSKKTESYADDLLGDAKKKDAPPRRAKGGDALDDLLLGAIGKKDSPPARKAEPAAAAPKSNLPQTPSREDMLSALGKAKGKAARCKGGGVATAAIKIAGSGRVTNVDVSGVEGAAKSCVEKAVRSTPFPKFQKDNFEVKFPFKLAG